jgi:hypothetical protein
LDAAVAQRAPASDTEQVSIPRFGIDWTRWWPVGFLLAGCIFGLTYLKAWSDDASGVHLMFWAAIAVIAVTIACLIASRPTFTGGFCASLALGVLLYLPKLLHSPTIFNYFDELSHLRAAEHLNAGQGLFLENPLNKAVEFFPGLGAAMGVLSSATGLSTFVVGNVLIVTAHALILGALFLLYERIADSTRVGLLSVAIFAASPAYIFFNSYFAYESLALPLAASAMAAIVLSDWISPRAATALLGITIFLGAAVVVTHHITSWVLVGILSVLGLWTTWATGWVNPISKRMIFAAVGTGAAAIAWLALVAPYTLDYVGPTFAEGADALSRLAGGDTEHRQLFYRSTAPMYEKYGSYLAVGILAVAFALTVLQISRRREWRERYLYGALATIGLTYFVSLPISFLLSNSAVSRVWDFAFLGVAPIVALALSHLFAKGRVVYVAVGGLLLFILLLGGVVSRTSLQQGLPGPYEPTADPRSMTADVLSASDWLLGQYGPEHVVTGDHTGFSTFGAYGDQQVTSGQGSGARPWRIFFPEAITPTVLNELNRDEVEYLVVDRRISEQLPRVGWYYSPNEPGALERSTPLPLGSLKKFANSDLFSRIYDNGNIVIYRYLPPPSEVAVAPQQ